MMRSADHTDYSSAINSATAGLQDFDILEVKGMAKSPTSFTDDEVVTLSVNLVTSFIALFQSLGFNFASSVSASSNISVPGYALETQTLVIIGAGSKVGKLDYQSAKLETMGTIIAIASESMGPGLRDLGHAFHRPTLGERSFPGSISSRY